MRYRLLIIIALILCILSNIDFGFVYANEEDSLTIAVDDTMNNIDTSTIDSFINDVFSEYSALSISFKEEVYKLLNGNTDFDVTSIVSFLISVITSKISSIMPSIIILFVIGVLGSVLHSSSDGFSSSKSVSTISTIATILITIVSFKEVMFVTKDIISNIIDFVSLLCPIIMSLLVSFGAGSSSIVVGSFSIISGAIQFVFNNVLYPIIIVLYIICVCNSISSFISLDKMSSFVSSVFKFILGITFTILFGFLSLQSLTILKFDSVSVRATKFAISSFVPFIGSYLSQGFDYVMMGSMLIKNGIGIVGIILIVFMVLVQIINIYILKLSFSFVSGVLEFIGDGSVSKYLDKFSGVLVLPIVLIVGVAFLNILLLMIRVGSFGVL